MVHIWEREMHKVLSWGKLNLREHFEDSGTDRRIILKWTLKTWNIRVRTGFIWFSDRTSCRKLQTPQNAGNLTEELLASEELPHGIS